MEYKCNISSHHFRHGMATGFLSDLGDLGCLENTVGSHMSFTLSM